MNPQEDRDDAVPSTDTEATAPAKGSQHFSHHRSHRSRATRARTRRWMWWWVAVASILAVTVVHQSHLALFAATLPGSSGGPDDSSAASAAVVAALLLGGGGASSANGAAAVVAAVAASTVVAPSPNNGTDSSAAAGRSRLPASSAAATPPSAASASSSSSSSSNRTLPTAGAAAPPPTSFPHGYPSRMADHAVRRLPQLLRQERWKEHPAAELLAPVPVVVWPLWEFGPKTAEAIHIEDNGLEESRWLVRSDDPLDVRPNVAWIGDTGYAYGWSVWCDKFLEQVRRAQQYRRDRNLPASWPTFIVDWTDSPTQQRCPKIERALGRQWVRYAKRSVIGWRHYNASAGWVHEGRLVDLNKTGNEYAPTPLTVRTDTVENLRDALRNRNLTLSDALERMERPTDVIHLWPLDPGAKGSGVGDVKSELRTRVSRLVWDYGNRTGRRVHVGLAGRAVHTGRRSVSSDYIEALLSTKIVVVTQRDIWEDHYRLFEALVSGALVVTDQMLSLPAGLRNGTSIVEVGSADQLESLLEHYLNHPDERQSVAREGRLIAMARHRSWHRLEEIVFGRPLTGCPEEEGGATGRVDPSSCPYVVHANETRQS